MRELLVWKKMAQPNKAVVARPAWADRMLEMYREGASDAEVAADQEMTVKNFYKNIENYPAVAQIVEFGRTLSQAYWESLARKNISNRQFNSPLYAFYMKNKFAWADKTENINLNENGSTDLDALRKNIGKEVADWIKTHTPEMSDAQRVFAIPETNNEV
jgi:hypothetical protein